MNIFNNSRYDEIMDKVKNKVKYYDLALRDNKYYLGLANGDSINLSFPEGHIPHLLGIHTDRLKSAGIAKNDMLAYDILMKLVNDDLTYISIKNTYPNFDLRSLFSDYIDAKLDIFGDILKVRMDDIYCVVKYNSERTYTTGEEKEISDYFIVRKHEKGYSVLGIVRKDDLNNYVPVTSRMFYSYDELKEFLTKISKNQEVTYPHSYRVDNYSKEFSKKMYPNLQQKLEFNKNLKDMAYKFKAIPSTNRDFTSLIERFINNRQKSFNNTSILTMIREGLSAGNIIDKEEVKLLLDDSDIPEELDSLIDVSNDLIVSKAKDNVNVNNSFSSIQNENILLKEELEALKAEMFKRDEQISSLESDNISLREENELSNQKLRVLTEAFESVRKM